MGPYDGVPIITIIILAPLPPQAWVHGEPGARWLVAVVVPKFRLDRKTFNVKTIVSNGIVPPCIQFWVSESWLRLSYAAHLDAAFSHNPHTAA